MKGYPAHSLIPHGLSTSHTKKTLLCTCLETVLSLLLTIKTKKKNNKIFFQTGEAQKAKLGLQKNRTSSE